MLNATYCREKGCAYHHTATRREYISRKCVDGVLRSYKGRFGEGFVILRPRWDTTQYCYCEYYVKVGE